MNVVIVGGGAFGTAIGTAIASSGADVTLLLRSSAQAASINTDRRNLKYLPDFRLPRNIRASTHNDCLRDAAAVFLAVPSHSIEQTCEQIKESLSPPTCVVNLAKGLHATHFTMNKAITSILPGTAVGSLKGPTFARPLVHEAPSGMTVAFDSPVNCETVLQLFKSSRVHVESWLGVEDIEFVSALKNVLAIAMGICDAIEDNANTRFLVIQKIINEARSLLQALGFNKDVLYTYAGLGDLLMTALNDTSRNRTLGLLLGRGFDLVVSENGPILEGKRSTHLICKKLGADLMQYEVINGLRAVFEHTLTPQEFFNALTQNRLAETVGGSQLQVSHVDITISHTYRQGSNS